MSENKSVEKETAVTQNNRKQVLQAAGLVGILVLVARLFGFAFRIYNVFQVIVHLPNFFKYLSTFHGYNKVDLT